MRKKKTTTANAIRQAELILKLYELRRETVMREARSYVGGAFLPASASEFIQIVSAGDKQSSFVLQVYGYWQMVAAFVKSGALDAELLYDTCPEMYFQYAKIQPYLAQFRQEMDLPEFVINVEQLVEGSRTGRKRLESMQKGLAALAETRSRPPIKSRGKKASLPKT
ncbi:DUF4760 domain-containing protein [Tunturiibacter gelidoferens]|jgi:hypothetical protein|uniref:Uncharacterized protein n=1 Tax=Tunturiibacter gelidiferens TaxID=3069689 RepID=A0A9X0QIB3_9BACT|nr:hypothetical protein [Edaphobacter lichenicola]MBB5331017.1 hypothetical protein [Edaphobacter lichenicola]